MKQRSWMQWINSSFDNLKSKIENPKWVGIFAMFLTFVFGGIVAQAQQPAKIPRIGYVSVSGDPKTPGLYVEAFRQGVQDLGYIDGKNILVEHRYAAVEPERVPEFVAELVRLKVNVLVSSSLGAIRAAKQATKTIPIVIVASQDPVAAGLVESLARPGGNITGSADSAGI